MRLWQLPVETCLDAGLGLVPLGAVTEAELPAVIGRMRQRIDHEATAEEAATLWTAANVLIGLRYSRELVFTGSLGFKRRSCDPQPYPPHSKGHAGSL